MILQLHSMTMNTWIECGCGTTSVEAADKDGWVVSITPSGGWLPACIAGNTGVGMSQRLQSFVLDRTLIPSMLLSRVKDHELH